MSPAWYPVYPTLYLFSINHWLKAGIMLADTAVILCNTAVQRSEDEQEHMVDAAHIMAVQKLATLFPSVSIVTDIHYRFNIRFMKFAEKNVFMAGAKALVRTFVSYPGLVRWVGVSIFLSFPLSKLS